MKELKLYMGDTVLGAATACTIPFEKAWDDKNTKIHTLRLKEPGEVMTFPVLKYRSVKLKSGYKYKFYVDVGIIIIKNLKERILCKKGMEITFTKTINNKK